MPSEPRAQLSHVWQVETAFRIDPMSASDIPAVVQLQSAYLDGSIVTELGPEFLTRFHVVALQHHASRGFVAWDAKHQAVGFALGSIDVHAFNRFVKPRVLMSLLRALLSPARIGLFPSLARMLSEGEPHPPVSAELLLLVVDPGTRRRGVGGGLLTAMEAAFAAENTRDYRVAVRSHLAAARAFYSALAFEHEQDRDVLGRPMVYLTKQLTSRERLQKS
jgi:ribosomal protein S18 acetylase RimI-like enzyme